MKDHIISLSGTDNTINLNDIVDSKMFFKTFFFLGNDLTLRLGFQRK
jgi:hypothetical protein